MQMFLSQLKTDCLKCFCKSKTGLNRHQRKLCCRTMKGEKAKGEQEQRCGWCLVVSHSSPSGGKAFLLDALRENNIAPRERKGWGFGVWLSLHSFHPDTISEDKQENVKRAGSHQHTKHEVLLQEITQTLLNTLVLKENAGRVR